MKNTLTAVSNGNYFNDIFELRTSLKEKPEYRNIAKAIGLEYPDC
jgi:hypothetical protein